MWSPTHIQVTVQRAKDLLTKGKNGTNNCFVTIALGKEKYQTSVKDKAETNVSWNEECELKIPDQGNRAELVLTCLHRNNLGIDEFLGQATLPLNEMDVYDRPRSKWFKLQSKPGKEKKNKERGELEVRISFIVKSGSLTDLSKKEKHKSSVGQLASSVGGSLLSIGTIEKRKGIKKFAKSLGSKMHLHSKKKNKDGDDLSFTGSFASIDTTNSLQGTSQRYGQRAGEADPGVISEDEDEFVFDNLSHKSSGSSLNVRGNVGLQVPQKNYAPRNPSPLLSVADNLAYKGNDIKEEPEHYIVNKRDIAYEQTQNNNVYEENSDKFTDTPKLPPPSSETKQSFNSDNTNEWDVTLYTQNTESLKRNTSLAEFKVLDYIPSKSNSQNLAVNVPNEAADPLPNESNALTNVDLNKTESSVMEKNKPKIENENDINSLSLMPDKDKENNKKKQKIDEWESKLYLDINKSDSLKRNTWQTARVQLPTVDVESPKTESQRFSLLFETDKSEQELHHENEEDNDDDSDSDDSDDAEGVQIYKHKTDAKSLDINEHFIANESKQEHNMPKPSPRSYTKPAEPTKENDNIKLNLSYESRQLQRDNLLDNIKMNLGYENKQIRAQNAIIAEEPTDDDTYTAKMRERNEEDQRILNFINDSKIREPPVFSEQSPKLNADKREKRFGKLKNFNEGGKQSTPRSNERIIIGHEKSLSHAERRSEMTEALAKKYEGKSREELMLIANGMENEVLIYRQRVKELEDYLDNLLLRVMETHPKILQNPYSRTNSTKSG